MSRRFYSQKRAFSLIEVVLAVAMLAITIVFVIGLLGTTSRALTDVQDSAAAARISEAVQDEFARMSFVDLAQNLDTPIVLYGDRVGDRVVWSERVKSGGSAFDLSERDRFPPRDWYYKIEVNRVGDPPLNSWETQIEYDSSYSTFVPLRVELEWPYMVPTGPGAENATEYEEDRRRRATYYASVRK